MNFREFWTTKDARDASVGQMIAVFIFWDDEFDEMTRHLRGRRSDSVGILLIFGGRVI